MLTPPKESEWGIAGLNPRVPNDSLGWMIKTQALIRVIQLRISKLIKTWETFSDAGGDGDYFLDLNDQQIKRLVCHGWMNKHVLHGS